MRVPIPALVAPFVLMGALAATAPRPHPATAGVGIDAAVVDTALARFTGTWTLTAHQTPIGDFKATLVVAADSGSALSIPALGVGRLALSGLVARGDTLDVPAAFFASPPGDLLSTSIRLVRTDDGTLVGAWNVAASDGSDIGTFRTTAVRGD